MEIKNLYDFQVWGELQKEASVYMIDYAKKQIINLNRLTVREIASIMKLATDNKMYSFYMIMEGKENE